MPAPAEQPASPATPDEPGRWLLSSPILDLEDPRLRVRAHAITQLCKTEREKAMAIYGFVKRLPFTKPIKTRLHTAREVFDSGKGDAPDKATLLLALLRLVGLPARIRYVELNGEILRGLTSNVSSAARPVAEIWLANRWVSTDTYIFDAGYMAAARQRLKDQDWEWGYGIHRNGHAIWNGVDSAFVGGFPTGQDPMVVADLGIFADPLDFVTSETYRRNHPRLTRALHWNLLAPMMDRAVRDLREEGAPGAAANVRKPS